MKIFGIISAVGVTLALLLLILAPTISETIAFRKFPPAEREKMKANYKKWRTEPVALPAAALDAKPYGEGIKSAARAFEAAWEKHKDAALKLVKEEETKPGVTAATADLLPLAPLMDAYTAIVRHPDYGVSAFSSNLLHDNGMILNPNFLAVRSGAKLLRVRALAEAREGKLDAALADVETIVRAARSGPYDILVAQLIGIAIAHLGAQTWGEVVRQCEDPVLLRRTLAAQNTLFAELVYFGDAGIPFEVVDYLGMIREMKRRGVAVEAQNLTGRQLVAKACDAQADYLENQVLPAVLKDPKLEPVVRQQITSNRKYAAGSGGPTQGISGMFVSYGGRLTAPILYTIAVPNFEEAATRADTARAKFDLLRIETARKLYRLEKGKAPADNEALVPEYLAQLPPDRHAKKEKSPYRLSGEIPYSIGPDGRDGALAIAYDTSNGTISAGDIALGK